MKVTKTFEYKSLPGSVELLPLSEFFIKTDYVNCNNIETCSITSASDFSTCLSSDLTSDIKVVSNLHPVSVSASINNLLGYSDFVCMKCVIHEKLTVESIIKVEQKPIDCTSSSIESAKPEYIINGYLNDPITTIKLQEVFKVVSSNPDVLANDCPIKEYYILDSNNLKIFSDIITVT